MTKHRPEHLHLMDAVNSAAKAANIIDSYHTGDLSEKDRVIFGKHIWGAVRKLGEAEKKLKKHWENR